MLSVTCKWPDGQWALVVGINRPELDGIWQKAQIALPIKNLPQVIAAPVLFVIMRDEEFRDQEHFEAMMEGLQERFPEEDTIVPILVSEAGRMALEDLKDIEYPSEKAFGERCPTGWNNCRHITLRFRETEQEFVASLEGRNKVDMRPKEPYTQGN